MWGNRRTRGDVIGKIAARTGDVRLKYEDDLKWSKAGTGQDLAYNDAVYAGAGSQAELQVGDSTMTVTENTLVVLRRDQDVSFLNLNYGTLFGKIAKTDKVVIETGNGKPIELVGSQGAQIVVRRTEGKTQLDVTSGEAFVTVDGRRQKVDKSTRLVFGDKSPAELLTTKLRATKPLKDQVIASENPMRIEFAWEWENGRKAGPGDRFTLEFSRDTSFKKIHITKNVQGSLTTDMSVSQSLSLWYRVKGPGNQVSQMERVNFVRLEKPLIIQPLAGARFEAPRGANGLVPLEFKRPDNATVWYQVASDPEFKNILVNQNTPALKQVREMAIGQYFLRARSDFGSNRLTEWTQPQAFTVEPKIEMLPLAKQTLPSRVVIPNRAYPSELYTAEPGRVKNYLAGRGTLRQFFPYKDGDLSELKVQMESGARELYSQTDAGWPVDKLYPQRYSYKYQATKPGYLPSEWSATKKLEIVMEPPKPLGDTVYGEPLEDGMREAQWNFTPILYARSYDVEVSPNPGFMEPIEFKTDTASARTQLPEGEFYWRARARDRQGRIISSFSKPYKMNAMPVKVPQYLAENKRERQPAATERTSTRAERITEKAWERSGWWAWLGTGQNYVDYRQSIPTRGTLQAHHLKGPSQYFEGGYTGDTGTGGVLSYKNTPGEFSIPGVPIYPNTFRWTTLSLEGLVKKTSPFSIGDTPIIYGMRAGVQQHTIPFLFLPAAADQLLLKNNQMNTASFGLLAEMQRARWTYYWLMRYQFPLTSKADGSSEFNMNPVFAFDGSIGTSYNITQRMKLGLFWYGQWHQFNFVYGDGDVTNAGFQSLFYSNIDLRFGMDF